MNKKQMEKDDKFYSVKKVWVFYQGEWTDGIPYGIRAIDTTNPKRYLVDLNKSGDKVWFSRFRIRKPKEAVK